MRCPFCSHIGCQVKDSRASEDNAAVRRRRFCLHCGARFTTIERVQLRELLVLKSNGERQVFDRDKLFRSLRIAVRKRNIGDDKIDTVVNSLVRRLESIGEVEIPSKTIGEMVMEVLAQLDMVAYIRFASVYRDFHEVKDFEDIIADVTGSKDSINKNTINKNFGGKSSSRGAKD